MDSHTSGAGRSGALAHIIREEVDAVLLALADASERQWSPSPTPKPREDTSERSSGGRPSDPTGDTVLDAKRLALRGAVTHAERTLYLAAVNLRAARKAAEGSVYAFDGGDRS